MLWGQAVMATDMSSDDPSPVMAHDMGAMSADHSMHAMAPTDDCKTPCCNNMEDGSCSALSGHCSFAYLIPQIEFKEVISSDRIQFLDVAFFVLDLPVEIKPPRT
jgi:hypothetical protein